MILSVNLSVCDEVYRGAQDDVGAESCNIVFLARHFLLTSSDTFAVVCII